MKFPKWAIAVAVIVLLAIWGISKYNGLVTILGVLGAVRAGARRCLRHASEALDTSSSLPGAARRTYQRSTSETSGRQLMPLNALVTKATMWSVILTSATDRPKTMTQVAASIV